MKSQLWKWILLSIGTALFACNTATVSERNHQIDALVAKAEFQMDTIDIQFYQHHFTAENNAISPPFLSKHTLLPWICEESDKQSKLYCTSHTKALDIASLSQYQKTEIAQAFQVYEKNSEGFIDSAEANFKQCNDSLKLYIEHLKYRLSKKIIDQSEYDHEMTHLEDTFLPLLRSMMEEDKIRIQLSIHYRVLTNEVQRILTEKQWEDFFSCVYDK